MTAPEEPDRTLGPPNHRMTLVRRQAWRTRLATAFRARDANYHSRSVGWRLLVPLVFLVAGVLFAASAISSGGTDLRAGRYSDLESLVRQEAAQVEGLRSEATLLNGEVTALSKGLDNSDVRSIQRKVNALRGPAGLAPAEGPGVTVTLDDAPATIQDTAVDVEAKELVVHQQDIQAVANALWLGGAEAMTIQGQRVVSTTGIKCVGNTVVLHEVPYAPPYVISAVGNTDEMLASIESNSYIDAYLTYVADYQLGWDVEVDPRLQMPAYDGPTELRYARPAGNTGQGDSGT